MTEAEALKRQSAIVLSSLEEQQQLAEALAEVENLSSKMSDMKKESEDKIADLVSQIETLKESTLLEENRSNIIYQTKMECHVTLTFCRA